MAHIGINRRQVWQLAAAVATLGALAGSSGLVRAQDWAGPPSPGEAKEIARDAYIYDFPIVQNYLSIYQFALDPMGSQYKGPPNAVHNVARVFTPADTGVITPNSDTPYSFLTMDLRAEPLVVTLPEIEPNRYYSLQLVDLYTHNVDYIGTRTDSNGGGDFLIAGPDWNGAMPAGLKRTVRSPTQLMQSQFRTQLFDGSDIEAVKRIQAGYSVQPLSAYAGQVAPAPAPRIEYPPISTGTFEPQFCQYVNFLLRFCPTLPSEHDLRQRLARIGIGVGLPWPPAGLSPEVVGAIEAGRQEARMLLEERLLRTTTSVGLFGTPQEMAGKYTEPAVGAIGGIYGNSTRYVVTAVRTLVNPTDPKDVAEVHALQNAIKVDQPGGPGRFEAPNWDQASQKKVRDALLVLASTLPETKRMYGSKDEVEPVRFLIGAAQGWGGNPEKEALYLNVVPSQNDGKTIYRLTVRDVPVDGFWSISLYNAQGYFERNPYDAYSLNNITAQKGSDGAVGVQFGGCDGKIVNCLPIMAGWNYMVRLYRPRAEILSGTWTFPEAQPVN